MRTGALIGLVFGLLWWLVGADQVAGFPGTTLQIIGISIFVLAGIHIFRREPGLKRNKPRWGYYIVAVVAEVATIALVQAWLTAQAQKQLLIPMVGIIVGLHFIGLWYAFARRRFLFLAAAMVITNLLALLLPLAPGTRVILSGFGSSAALIVTALLP